MRVAVFNYGSGGLFHYACSLVNALAKTPEIEKIIFFTSARNTTALINTNEKIRIVTSDAPHTLLSFFGWLLNIHAQYSLTKTVRDFRPDVIHITDTYPVYPWHHLLWRRFKIVYTQHDPLPHAGESFSWSTMLLQTYCRTISRAIIVHGQILQRQLRRYSRRSRRTIFSVPLGEYSILLQQPPATSVKTIPSSILFFGRIRHYKGLDVLLQALLQLQAEEFPFHFTLAGAGDLAAYQTDLQKIRTKRVLNFIIPDQDVAQLFVEAEIVVLPYREATQSAVSSLALAAHKPLIASRVGALPEVLTHEHNCLLVAPGDASELMHAIRRLLGDSALRAQLARGAAETLTTKMSWSKIAQQHIAIYRSL